MKINRKWLFIGIAALLCISAAVVLVCALAGGKSDAPTKEPTGTQSGIPAEETNAPQEGSPSEELLETASDNVGNGLNSPNPENKEPADEVLDYSALNPAEQYEAVLPIILGFDGYVGKTLRAYGMYQIVNGFPHIYVYDNINCCYAWLELVYDGEYPAEGDLITVEGKLGYYEDDKGEECPCIFVSELLVSEV